AKRRPQAQVGAEGARVALRREARVAALAVHLGPEDVHERVARGGGGERVERRLGLVEPALRDQVAREEQRDRRALGMAPPEPAVEPGGALGLALARVQALEALQEDDRRPPPCAALPHPPRREAAARTLEEVARAHPGGHEARVTPRHGDRPAAAWTSRSRRARRGLSGWTARARSSASAAARRSPVRSADSARSTSSRGSGPASWRPSSRSFRSPAGSSSFRCVSASRASRV